MKHLFLALRPVHWIKNLFIFLPLIFGKKMFDYPENLTTIIAFIVFCLAASAVYIVNDIIDVKKDKAHPTKKLRPIASGKISIRNGMIAASTLFVISLVLSISVNPLLGVIVLAYFIFNLIYSKILKDIVIVDVFCIGAFFLLRIIAGSLIAGVNLSHWMIFMIVLLALFLGFNKRRQEIKLLKDESDTHRGVLAEYSTYFIDQIIAVITSSVVIVYMMYTVDSQTVGFFGTDHLIYTVPFVYYGIFRYLYIIHKKRKVEDPTTILITDKVTQANIFLWLIVCIMVIYGKI